MFRAAVLAGLLLLAGCSGVPGGLSGGGTPSPTVTPAPVPAATETPDRYLVPGVTSDGVVDPLALTDAHYAVLGNRYRFRMEWTVRSSNGSVLAHSEQRTLVTPDGFRSRFRVRGEPGFLTNGPPLTATFWSNGSVVAERVRRNGSVGYRYLDAEQYNSGAGFYSSLRRPKPWRDHTALFGSVEAIPVARQVTSGGTAYVVSGTTVTEPERFGAATGLRRPGNVTLRAVIDERGLVRDLRLDYDGVRPDGRRVDVDRTVTYRAVENVTAPRQPDWFGSAVNGSRLSRGSIPNP